MDQKPTIEQRMRASQPELTPTEQRLVSHILSHYPVSALGSITALARAAEVSSPSIVRLVQKLGYRGYTDYQAALRAEIETMLVTPLAWDGWGNQASDGHVLNRFAARAVHNLQATLTRINAAEFDEIAALLADPARKIFVMGGRITHAHADHLSTLLSAIRPGVTLVSDMANGWQQALLDIGPGDTVVLFDIRRYEASVITAAELVAELGARIVLFTDRGISPAARFADYRFACQIDMPSAWDSTVSLLFLVECLVASVQSLTWAETEGRLKRLEEFFARTQFFRRPR
ncbi:MAG: MurR/RpiR family transcriptional regulator [Tabrizicola sp.]|nr:MurR/RpiR family transcriptional regulator [Tabrizicola sp.]